MKPMFLLLLGATTAPDSGIFVSGVVVVAAVLLVMNSLGLLPRGKTAERLKLERDEAERLLSHRDSEVARLGSQIEALKSRPDLSEHAQLLHAMTESLQGHDIRMNAAATQIAQMAEKGAETYAQLLEQGQRQLALLNSIAVAVIPPELPRD